jgi:ribosomal peptide maturation radical SAM protein 1
VAEAAGHDERLAAARPQPRVLLAVMPFLSLKRPALGVSALKSELGRRGIACDVRYLTFPFADRIGVADYQRIAQAIPTHHLVGDWIFTDALYGPGFSDLARFHDEVLGDDGDFYDEAFLAVVHAAARVAPAFVAACADGIEASSYDVVGFTSTFQQTVASLAVAKELKARRPGVVIAFGGANAEGEMGVELHRQFDFLDVVVDGEADWAFPECVRRLAAGEPLDGLEGVTFRRHGKTVPATGRARAAENLDDLAFPDEDDFFAAFQASSAAGVIRPESSIETSRGCWWGERHHCTFCGLNGQSMAYRSKSPRRAYDEIAHLVRRHHTRSVFATDNILDLGYFDELFPRLEADGLQVRLFYETKANLRKAQLRQLRGVGADWFQPGIEHLSTPVLKIMDKGVKGIQNVQLLKWAQELGFRVTWNILCGFPGERPEDYQELARTIPLITHLQPPSSFAPFRLDRFSPMFNDPARFGLTGIRPYEAYRWCYPFGPDVLARIAYFFRHDSVIDDDTARAIGDAWLATQAWRAGYGSGALVGLESDLFVVLHDTRPGRPPGQHLLFGLEKEVYRVADAVQSVTSLRTRMARASGATVAEGALREILDGLVERGVMLREDNLYLALATFPGGPPDDDPEAGRHREPVRIPVTAV